jgi:glyoxylate/hydroxypyruvate reductase A
MRPSASDRSALSEPPPVLEREPIALIGQLGQAEQEAWLRALRLAMPDERIELAATLEGRAEQAAVRLAIVANPDPAVVQRFANLQWVHSVWAGVEKLVGTPAFDQLPVVRLVDPELARTMAEAVLAWTLYLHRDMPAYRAAQRQAQWRPRPYRSPASCPIGLLGLGELGRRAASVLTAAGFPVLGWSRTPRSVPGVQCHHGVDGLRTVVNTSQILVLLLPATPQTRGLVNRQLLAQLPIGAGLINFGRGSLVVAEDLIASLDADHLGHAVLDVFETEPLPADSPLWLHDRITVLPHISATTTTATASAIVARHIAHWRRTGELPPTVDRARGY